MKITKRQLRKIIHEVAWDKAPGLKSKKLEDLLNSWLYDKVTIEHVKGRTYLIRGVDASSMIEVKEEIREFPGASFEYELGRGNKRDVGVWIE
jgi:hypothetical protein